MMSMLLEEEVGAATPRGDLLRTEPRHRCPLCGGAGGLLHADVPDHYFGVEGSWSLRRCRDRDCDLIWQDPMVVREDLGRAYEDYYTHSRDGRTTRTSLRPTIGAGFFRLDRWCTRLLSMQPDRERFSHAYLDSGSAGALLDVGCGNGDFLSAMRPLGWSVRGTELDGNAASIARSTHGLQVDVGELRELGYPAASFDAVTARHVIEHVRDAVPFVAECWRILKPGGRLVLVTPNAASLGHRHFGRDWRGLEQPRHLFLYSPAAMGALLRRAGLPAADVFSTAQGAAYILRTSAVSPAVGGRSAWRRQLDRLAIWWLQYREVAGIRSGLQVGEELVAIVRKA